MGIFRLQRIYASPYYEDEINEEKLEKMTDSQKRLYRLDKARESSDRRDRTVAKRMGSGMLKGGALGALGGAAAAGLGLKSGQMAIGGALLGGYLGGGAGAIYGSIKGRKEADQAGYLGYDDASLDISRRFDKFARKKGLPDSWELEARKEIRDREAAEEEAARKAREEDREERRTKADELRAVTDYRRYRDGR